MSNLANIARAIDSSLTRNQLKVLRARLRRANLTNLSSDATGAYTINTGTDCVTDCRTVDGGTVIVQAIAEMVA